MTPPGPPSHSRFVCGRVLAMKPCLKSPLPRFCAESNHRCSKTVGFGEEIVEEVYLADVWDRTPTEPTKKLSYQDLLELKEIQRSLPRANQLDDPVSGKPASHYLSSVPIGLLPLLSESPSSSQGSSTNTSPVTSPPLTPPLSPKLHWLAPPPQPPRPAATAPSIPRPWHPAHLAHLLPSKPQPQREKPRFAFLPLLDTPPSSESSSPYPSSPSSRSSSPDLHTDTDTDTDSNIHDPPTPSLTNASLDSSPRSRCSSIEPSPEPRFLQLPSLPGDKPGPRVLSLPHSDDFDPHTDPHIPDALLDDVLPSMRSLRVDNGSNTLLLRPSSLFFPPPSSGTTAWNAFPTRKAREVSPSPCRLPPTPTPTPTPVRRRNIMVVNGVEIDMDDDDDDKTPSSLSTPLASPHLGRGDHTPLMGGRELPVPVPLALPPSALPLSPSQATAKCGSAACSPMRFQRDRPAMPAAI